MEELYKIKIVDGEFKLETINIPDGSINPIITPFMEKISKKNFEKSGE